MSGNIRQPNLRNLPKNRCQNMIAIIGVDGYDYIPTLLVKYQEDM
jgi:hypothetical protein